MGVPTVVINFDKATTGETPPGWSCMTNQGTASKWAIVKDSTAPTPPYVFAQISNDADDTRFPVAILDKHVFQNCEICVRIKPVSGNAERDGGLGWRFCDTNNYYVGR